MGSKMGSKRKEEVKEAGMTAFMFYTNEELPGIKKELDLNHQDAMKEAWDRYDQLPQDEKKHYEDLEAQEQERLKRSSKSSKKADPLTASKKRVSRGESKRKSSKKQAEGVIVKKDGRKKKSMKSDDDKGELDLSDEEGITQSAKKVRNQVIDDSL
mmetsp:Transcript_41068/g.30209  ORF Transcript_41068/g.30209 Transcript_41068/m.30209 type:complete len:156 (+) Transcript_41068:452-919(+)